MMNPFITQPQYVTRAFDVNPSEQELGGSLMSSHRSGPNLYTSGPPPTCSCRQQDPYKLCGFGCGQAFSTARKYSMGWMSFTAKGHTRRIKKPRPAAGRGFCRALHMSMRENFLISSSVRIFRSPLHRSGRWVPAFRQFRQPSQSSPHIRKKPSALGEGFLQQ
jgi:hypothetical protein